MNYCPFCRSEIQHDSMYCGICGKKLPEAPVGPSRTALTLDPQPHRSHHKPKTTQLQMIHSLIRPYSFQPGNKAPL